MAQLQFHRMLKAENISLFNPQSAPWLTSWHSCCWTVSDIHFSFQLQLLECSLLQPRYLDDTLLVKSGLTGV